MQEVKQEAKLEARYQMWVARGGRVRLEPTERRVRAIVGGTTIADSKRAQLLFLPPPFNSYAFPRDDVRLDVLAEYGEAISMPGVGEVARWSIAADGEVRQDAAWTFPHPPVGLEPLAGLVVFRWRLVDAWYEEDDEVFVHLASDTERSAVEDDVLLLIALHQHQGGKHARAGAVGMMTDRIKGHFGLQTRDA